LRNDRHAHGYHQRAKRLNFSGSFAKKSINCSGPRCFFLQYVTKQTRTLMHDVCSPDDNYCCPCTYKIISFLRRIHLQHSEKVDKSRLTVAANKLTKLVGVNSQTDEYKQAPTDTMGRNKTFVPPFILRSEQTAGRAFIS
jgi:hypothetical protein